MTEKKRYLVLEDGTVFEGYAFGGEGSSVGELVFTTGMCGYIETLTDPSYYGQIVLQTFPMIGNYGVIPADFEGECCVRGYVVREVCGAPSNFRAESTVDAFLKEKNIPGICGVDTRAITKIIREHGVLNAMICDEIPADLSACKAYTVQNAVAAVTRTQPETLTPPQVRFRVALLDYGAKNNIARELMGRGCRVTVLPAATTADEILRGGYDGVMLSNDPGDPAENRGEIAEIGRLFGEIPLFGICLGHQLLALSQGAGTVKLKYGHRGANQPVRETDGPRTYITSQNHGYAVVGDSVRCGNISFANANDGTVEGIDYPDKWAFSVQFHPEACSGPHDTSFLFDKFCNMMEEHAHATRQKH